MKARLLFMLLALLLAGCGSPGATATPQVATQPAGTSITGTGAVIPIGAVWSLSTGAGAAYGPSQKNASEMAVMEINGSGMLGTMRLNLITEDDRSDQAGANAAFEKLINQDKVVAILGPTLSNSAKSADPIAQSQKVVVLGVSNTASGIVEIGDFIFRNSLPESVVVPNTVKVTKEKLGYSKVAVMYGDDDAFTNAGYQVFKQALESSGVEILGTETFKKGDTDYSAQLTKIRGLNPDVIVVSALADEAANILVQARQLGIPETVRFIGGNGFNSPKLAQIAGPAAEGAISGAAWFTDNETPGNQQFVAAYKAQFGIDPDQFAAQAYAGVYILATAIKNAGSSDPQSIRDAMAKIKDLDTILGTFSFAPDRNPVHTPIVQVVQGGKFQLFK